MKTGKELRAVLGLEGGNIPLLNVTWETGQLAVREQGKKNLKRHHGLFSNKRTTEMFMFQRIDYLTDSILTVDQTCF